MKSIMDSICGEKSQVWQTISKELLVKMQEKRKTEFEKIKPRKFILSSKTKPEKFNIDVYGFDTETVDGKAILIACSDGRFIFPKTFVEILTFLTKRKYRNSLNFFYNIDYDFFAIMKFLHETELKALYIDKQLKLDDFTIKWIPRKAFIIKKGKESYRFFDLYNYYRSSLQKASRKYLNESKEEIDIKNVEKYVKDPKLRIQLVKYCLKDCELTAKLANLLQQKLNSINLSFQKPFSPASIAARFFRSAFEGWKFIPTEWQKYAYLSYYGGRFELVRRGYFKKVYQYDINSAYPYAIAQLPDIRYVKFYKTSDIIDDAVYVFARILIHNMPDNLIQPIPAKLPDGLVIYPQVTQSLEHYVTKIEIELLDKIGADFDIIDCWNGIADKIYYPFKNILSIYDERKKYKQTDEAMDLTLKLIMNSLYGKFFERIKAPNGELIAGKFFNPVYASYITAYTRKMLFETALKEKKHIIAFQTDSIIVDKPFVEESDEIGKWKKEMEGEALIVLTGIYTIRNEHKTKTRFRGFKLVEGLDLIDLFEEHANESSITWIYKKVLRLGEVITRHKLYNIMDLNLFVDYVKTLDIMNERKRNWEDYPLVCKDLLDTVYHSQPLHVI